ncbi:MAG: hypothetical protein VX006_01550, partial [Pseudomonadota bacterium]|nr:hypothetical protein [Pseudomonadota bacterium]
GSPAAFLLAPCAVNRIANVRSNLAQSGPSSPPHCPQPKFSKYSAGQRTSLTPLNVACFGFPFSCQYDSGATATAGILFFIASTAADIDGADQLITVVF